MSALWYYSKSGEQVGPISESKLRIKLATGVVSPDDLVWREGMDAWITASELPELHDFDSPRPAPPPLPRHAAPPNVSATPRRTFRVVAGVIAAVALGIALFFAGHQSSNVSIQFAKDENVVSHLTMKPTSSFVERTFDEATVASPPATLSKNEAERRRLEDERRRLEEETRLAALKAEAERIQRVQEDERRERLERETKTRHESLIRKFADQAGNQIIGQVGGGRDLIVSVRSWTFDKIESRFDADVSISFNGAVFRGNNYQLEGRLRVGEDGSNPQFARNYANDKFKSLERNLKWAAAGAVGVIMLNEMKSNR